MRRDSENSNEFRKRVLKECEDKVKVKQTLSVPDFMDMKSTKIVQKPRIDEYIHELSH